MIGLSCPQPACAQGEQAARWTVIEARLQQRLADRPNDASTWRMLGRLRLKRGAQEEAFEAFLTALKLDPQSAAAHFDVGRMLLGDRHPEAARTHFKQVLELAPDSEYARDARQFLQEIALVIGEDEDEEQIEQVGYRVKDFTGSEISREALDERPALAEPLLPFYFRMESGVLYNTNVALTPIDRELSPDARDSVQAFVSPEFEYSLHDSGDWRFGPAFAGYFSLNEGDFREFNVQNYQPGLFSEWILFREAATFVPRVQYDFAHDEFDGETFGNRHAVTASSAAVWENGHRSFVYWAIDDTNFLDDGTVPSISSRDGWTNAVGLSHRWPLERRRLKSIRAGIDLQRADLKGSDYSYQGISLYSEAEIPLPCDLSLLALLGWGYRDYFEFEFTPSRNEHILQGGLELRKPISEHLTVACVLNYDRFVSENVLFEAERYISGIMLTCDY